ncbi:hypothetical protein ODJ79_00730 [Actinoplanes sp. KI2]|uniref:hypothetical protein n=1 Tax=Actinoplanes sp. KI2 TaxID=2983315 RepID=UPI0021D60ACD|nr:hypothetical protein [Actinoplanes sp. KI2]MCU7722231.1 hypothetical protein [Actinoplanes sp. KI2]
MNPVPHHGGNRDFVAHLRGTRDRLAGWTIRQIVVHSSSEKRCNMSSTLLKVAFAGAVSAGALFLPVTAAQAAPKNLPCDGPGFGNAFFGGGGFGGGIGGPFFGGGDFGGPFYGGVGGIGYPGGGLGLYDTPPVVQTTKVIVVTAPSKKHHHKPANHPTGGGSGPGSGSGNGGYHRGSSQA